MCPKPSTHYTTYATINPKYQVFKDNHHGNIKGGDFSILWSDASLKTQTFSASMEQAKRQTGYSHWRLARGKGPNIAHNTTKETERGRATNKRGDTGGSFDHRIASNQAPGTSSASAAASASSPRPARANTSSASSPWLDPSLSLTLLSPPFSSLYLPPFCTSANPLSLAPPSSCFRPLSRACLKKLQAENTTLWSQRKSAANNCSCRLPCRVGGVIPSDADFKRLFKFKHRTNCRA